jgi:putative ATP-binding cassette transporter
MRLLRFLLADSRLLVALSVISGIITGLGSAALIAIIHNVLSNDAPSRKALILSYTGLCLLILFARYVSAVVLIRFSQRVTTDLRIQLSRRMLAAPLRQLEEIGPHRLLAALIDDVATISNAVVNVPIVSINLAVLAGCLIYLGTLSWAVLLTVLLFIGLGVISYQMPLKRAQGLLRSAREKQNELFKNFRGLVEGTKELKIHNRRSVEFLSEVLETSANDLRQQTVDGMSMYAAASSWGQFLLYVFIGLLLFVMSSWQSIGNDVLIGCALIALYMVGSVEIVVNVIPLLGRANIAIRNIEQLGLSLAERASELQLEATHSSSPAWDRIDFLEVLYRYRRDGEPTDFVLGPLKMSLVPGEIVFLTGGNGSGKTTFAKLVTGLYAPDSGEVRLNDVPVTDQNRALYRQLFSVVFYDFYLFDKVLGLGSDDLDPRANHYLGQLQLDRKVKVNGGTLSTLDLSQGQRKRLALLTAYLEDRPIYVFDEWAADQDPLFKNTFYHQLLPELKQRGKTVLVISHDDRYFDVADRMIKLDEGRIDGMQ